MKTHKRFHFKSVVMLMAIPLLLVAIMPTLTALADGDIPFIEHTIDDYFDGAYSVYATDVDGDGDVDILGAAYNADDITWWENDGSQNFIERTIDTAFDGARSVYAADLDGDNDIDVLGAAVSAGDIAWWENDGSENFTKHIIDSNFSSAECVYAIDMDGDADIDVLGAAWWADDITWWENDGSENFAEHTIDGNFDGAISVYAIDMDDDDDVDILGVANLANDIAWWENDGSENFTKHIITDTFSNSRSVYAIDMDSDGDVDVIGAASGADDVIWWANDGSQNFTEHAIANNLDGARSVYATDVDSDGDIDVLGAASDADDVAWWENDGSENFTEHTIDGAFDGAYSVYAIDLDGDGDIDVLGAAYSADDITWWEQVPALSISNSSVTEGNSGSVNAVFSVTLSITSTQAITVEYATADGSAVAPADYTVIPSTTLVFPPGAATQFINVSVQGDSVDEPDETFWVNLANPVNASLGDAQGQGTIIDDDLATISFSSATYNVNEDAGQATITVTLGAASDMTVTVNYTASGGSATSGTGAGWTYTLEEDEDLAFPSPETRYTGPGISWNASDQAAGTYYYRARASSPLGESDWSDIQSVKVGPPDIPVLNPIDNPDSDGDYTVSWNAASGAQTYTLEEDDDSAFSSPTTVYFGSEVSKSITGRDLGTYHYRVRASNGFGNSDWSNAEPITVIVLPPCSPTPGSWSGTGSYPVSSASFAVSSDSNTVTRFGMSWSYPGACGHASFSYLLSRSIDQDCHFYGSMTSGSATFSWAGDFTSSSAAAGTWGVSDGACSAGGTWQATGPSYYQGEAGNSMGNNGWSNAQLVNLGPPDTPVLYPISNPDGDGNYSVSWSGGDYTAVSGTLTFTPDETTYTFTIPIADDTLDENDETINLSLSNPDNGTLLIPTLATLTIVDDDPAPTINFSSAAYSVEEADSATITVTLSAASGLTVTVDYAASDGTATAPADYTAVSGTLTFSPGQTSRSFAVPIFSDTLDEEDETVNLALGSPTNVTPGTPHTATLTILDDDGDDNYVYLPFVVKTWPPIPGTPVLNSISNLDGDGNYTVSWGSAERAESYTLHVATNAGFTNAAIAYQGTNTLHVVSSQPAGTHYYRIKAANQWGESGWSNVQSVTVVPPPDTPVLNPIDNPDGDGNYTASWNLLDLAETYTLQEDNNPNFLSPTTIYTGTATSASIAGRGVGVYYYRVRAVNPSGHSDWSQVQLVDVTVGPPPGCPQIGSWAGTTGQDFDISFTVAASDTSSCRIQGGEIKFRLYCPSCQLTFTTSFDLALISDDHFDTGDTFPRVYGDFTSDTESNGNWYGLFNDPSCGRCEGGGTWTATYSP